MAPVHVLSVFSCNLRVFFEGDSTSLGVFSHQDSNREGALKPN